MKRKIPFLLAGGIVPLATAVMGQDFSPHPYLSADLGAAFQENLRIRSGDLIDFHNGVRGDITLGYQKTRWVGMELQTGVIWNSGDKIGGATISSFGGRMDLYQIPVMANLVLTTPAWHGFRPYAGAGFGGVAAMMRFERPLGSIRDTDVTFSYQAFGGLNYEISEHFELGVGYKYLQTDNHDWIENGVTLKTEGTTVHSVTASLSWKF